jgi:hypothetical protein
MRTTIVKRIVITFLQSEPEIDSRDYRLGETRYNISDGRGGRIFVRQESQWSGALGDEGRNGAQQIPDQMKGIWIGI